MKIPLWRKYLSYIKEIPIEVLESDVNDYLELLLVKGRLQLCTENAIYSFDDLYSNYDLFFSKVDWKRWQPSNCLILGYGLGSISYLLEKKYNQNLDTTGIELDEAIIYLASKYALPRLKSQISVIPTDAYFFLQQNKIKFDFIAVDLFIDSTIPDPFLTQEFLTLLKNTLSPKGMIAFNHLAYTTEKKEAATAYFENVFKPVFDKGKSISVHKNHILTNDGLHLF